MAGRVVPTWLVLIVLLAGARCTVAEPAEPHSLDDEQPASATARRRPLRLSPEDEDAFESSHLKAKRVGAVALAASLMKQHVRTGEEWIAAVNTAAAYVSLGGGTR